MGADDWLPAARAGSREALGEGLQACQRYLLWVARRELDPDLLAKGGASDLVQETFLEAQRDFQQFEGSSEEELLAWLRRLLLNNIANFVRRYRTTAKRGVGRETLLGPDYEPAYGGQSPSQEFEKRDNLQVLLRLVEKLPENYRQIMTLWFKDYSFEEIGRQLGKTPNAARMMWMRAIERLQRTAANEADPSSSATGDEAD